MKSEAEIDRQDEPREEDKCRRLCSCHPGEISERKTGRSSRIEASVSVGSCPFQLLLFSRYPVSKMRYYNPADARDGETLSSFVVWPLAIMLRGRFCKWNINVNLKYIDLDKAKGIKLN